MRLGILVIGLVVAVAAPVSHASAEATPDYVISSGREGGYYNRVATSLARTLIEGRKTAFHLPSVGSLQNLKRMSDPEDPTNITIAQLDAAKQFADDNPAFRDDNMIVDDLGKECVVLVTAANGGIENAGDLKKKSGRALAIDGSISGAAVTYELMSRLDPAFRNTPVEFVDTMEALVAIRLGSGSPQLAALMLVQRPRTVSPALELVLENPDVFNVAPVRKEDFSSDVRANGKPVYTNETVTTGFGIDFAVKYESVCTRALLLASRTKLDDPLRHHLAETMLKSGKFIAPGRR